MTNEEILQLIRSGPQGRDKVARFLYNDTRLIRGVRHVMRGSARNDSEFWNIVHTMILQFFKYVLRNPHFELEHSYHSYLVKSAQNLWYMHLRRRNKNESPMPENYDIQESGISFDVQLENEERRGVIEELLERFGNACKKVLLGWAQGKKMEEMQIELGFVSVEAVRKRKFDCLKKISKYVEENPGVRRMFE